MDLKFHLLVFIVLFVSLLFTSCKGVASLIVSLYTPDYKVSSESEELKPVFLGKDENRPRIEVFLAPVASTYPQITDIQFPPRFPPRIFLVTEKEGNLKVVEISPEGKKIRDRLLARFKVLTRSEEGLLGVAFHPRFPRDLRIFVNLVAEGNGEDRSRIIELTLDQEDLFQAKILRQRIILEVSQPYPNHNAGQLAFGPDGYLYIGLGDGGWRGDPHKNGQNPRTWLGKMLRVDVDRNSPGRNYAIPQDNPFLDDPRYLPEIYALGFRNPWRYSFDLRGRLIVADVGQDAWEEINWVEPGGNYGWNIMEGFHCYDPPKNCPRRGLRLPIYEYGHDEGQSITGGYVYWGKAIPELKDLYIFGDFVQGKIWAIPLPKDSQEPVTQVYTLGKWPLLISTFGQDSEGELYVGDFNQGMIYKIVPHAPSFKE